MESYKREFIQFLEGAGVLKFGDFTAKSGRKIPYFINAGMIKTGDDIAKLGEFYAKAYFEKLGAKKAVLYGPAYKGISLAVSAAVALSKKELNVPFFFNRKEVKDHGEGGVFVGYVPQAGEEIVIIEDVITAGTAIRESMEILSHLEGTKVAATFIMVDRKEKGQTEKGAMQEIEEQFGFPVYSIVDVYDIIEYLEEDPKNEENVTRIKNYLAVNGAKAYADKLGDKKSVLYGPAYKGISLSISAAVALSKNGLDLPFFFNRKEVKDHGEGGTFVGYVPQAGEEIVIIEDVITAGTAIRESMEILSHLEGTKVIATFIMVDRKEKGQTEKGAMQEIEEQFGFPVYSVVDVYDIIEYLEEDPANEENVTRIKNYLAVNGAK